MAANLILALDRDRFRVEVLALGKPSGSDIERMLENSHTPIHYLGKGAGFDVRIYSRFDRFLKRQRPAVIHTHVHVLRYTLPSMLYRSAPAMLHTVHNLAEHEVEGRAQWLQKFALAGSITPVACAREVAHSLERRYGIRDALVIPNCIPVRQYRTSAAAREEWREREGISREERILLSVARFAPQKNHELLIRAFAIVAAHHRNARLVLAGRGESQQQAERLTATLGIGDRVKFLGLRTDVPNVLSGADIFVLSSDYEGNPLALMEAMAAGLPVVSTAVGGVPELIEEGKEGLLVKAGDVEALADRLARLLADDSERLRMGKAASSRAEREFDIGIMAAKYSALYDQLLRKSPGCEYFRRVTAIR
jgi:glycosyltransferase involved in cell wall biosynthesis